MKEYSSDTIVESTVFFNLLTFIVNWTSCDDRSRDSAKTLVMPLCEDPSSVSQWEAVRNPIVLNGPVSGQELKFHWL